jgi:TonB-linked SusC/RagA family outer membrane protein
MGMKTVEFAASDNLTVVLEDDSEELGEVVVTALGISREKKALGYAVQDVKSDELLKTRGGLNNPVNALQGKVAGLQILSSTGALGGSAKVLIRGVKSISGNNQPLFVIDGVPIEGSDYNSAETERGAGGFDYGNLIQDLNPDDIENISVLKGPNASALYGSRATNGVIMITTKKGTGKKGGGLGVTFSTSIGIETVNKLPKLQRLYGGGYGDFYDITINGEDYKYPVNEEDVSWGPRYENQNVVSWYDIAKWEAGGKVGNPSTSKWQAPEHDIDDFFETGVSLVNNLSILQNTDHSSIRLSYTNSDLKGYMPNSSLKKNVFNVSASTSPHKKLEMFTNITYLNSAAKGRSEVGYGDNNVMVKFVQWGHRELDMQQLKEMYKYPDGSQITWNRVDWNDPTAMYSNNPYWTRYMNYQNDTRNRVYGNIGLSYAILDYLKFQYKSNLDFYVDNQYERNAIYSQEESRYKELSRQQHELNHEFLLLFNKTSGDFSYSATAGANLMKRNYERMYGETIGGLVLPEFYNLSTSVGLARSYNTKEQKSINSLFASGTIGYKGTVYIDASVRNDWSSTLPKENNSYLYPSVTGSFIFSELLKDAKSWLSFGKVRVGFAQVGSDTDPYQLRDVYTFNNAISSTPGYILSNTQRNPDLRPEITTSFEVGLEATFVNNRIGIEATYYSGKTKDQIIPLTISGTTGYSYSVINAGSVSNKGVEFRLYGTPVKTADFSWETSLVLASNKNKVEELLDGVDYYRLTNAPFKVEIGAIKGQEFMIMGTDYVYKDGQKVILSNGRYASTDGNVPLAKIYPDFTGGWNNTFRYKNLDLSVLFDFSRGGHYFSTSYMWGMYSGMLEETVATNENGKNIRDDISDNGGLILDGVLADGTPNTRRISGEAYGSQFYSGPAAQNVLKSDFIKLREINIGYTIPVHKTGILQSLRVAAYGRNLAIWGPDVKHFDPDVAVTSSGNVQGIEGGATAGIANYGLNITLKF